MLSMTLRILISTIAAIVVVLVHELSKYYISLFLLHPIHRKRSDVKISPALNPSFYFKMIQNERIIQAVFILLIAFNILSSFINSLFGPLYSLIS